MQAFVTAAICLMKASDPAAHGQLEKLRQRLEKLDAERAAIAAEIHRLAEPDSILPPPPVVKKDPIPASEPKDWHVFAGPAKPKPRRR